MEIVQIIIDNINYFPLGCSKKQYILAIIMFESQYQFQRKISCKKSTPSLKFIIYYQQWPVLTLRLPCNERVIDLIHKIKNSLGDKYGHIHGLCSLSGLISLDFTLTDLNYPLLNYKDQHFRLLLATSATFKNKITLKDLQFLKCIGEGSCSVVYVVRHNPTGLLYALKQIQKSYLCDFEKIQQTLRQKKVLSELLDHFGYATKLYATFESADHLNFLMQYYPQGELHYQLHKNKLSEQQLKLYFAQIVVALQNIHQKKIVYRNLKLQNILLDQQGHIRLCGFRKCRLNVKSDEQFSSKNNAQHIRQYPSKYFAQDFYALGVLLYLMIVRTSGKINKEQLQFPSLCDPDWKFLVCELLDIQNAKNQDRIKSIKSSKWLSCVNWQAIKKKQYIMPFKINPYQSYIQQSVKNIPVHHLNSKEEHKYDFLFEAFYFISQDHPRLYQCYKNKELSKSQQLKLNTSKNNKLIKYINSQLNAENRKPKKKVIDNQSLKKQIVVKRNQSKGSNKKQGKNSRSNQKKSQSKMHIKIPKFKSVKTLISSLTTSSLISFPSASSFKPMSSKESLTQFQ